MAGLDSYVKLLLHCDGTDASTSFPDASASAHTVTANGDAQVDTAQSKFGGASAYFDGTGDYLSVPDSADWNFGSGDFTIDMWIRPANTSGIKILYSQFISDPSRQILYLDGATLKFYSAGGASVVFSGGSVSASVWQHIALVRYGDVYKLYIDGVSGGTTTVSGALPDFGSQITIGKQDWASNEFYYAGWDEEIRISKGIARWTANFTPPTAAYDIEYPIDAAGSSTTVGTLDVIEAYVIAATGESSSAGLLGYSPSFILSAESESDGILITPPDYDLDCIGSSTSTGFFNIKGQYLLYGSSTTLGTLLLVRWPIIAAGVSNTSGVMETLHHRFRELTGESSSAGDMPLHRDMPLSAVSTSSGLDMLKRLMLYVGSSSSSGTLTLSEIEALEVLACYLINLDTKRTRQYTNYAFTGIGRFNGKMLASFADGIYDLDTVAKYDGTSSEIAASLEIKTDFGTANYKAVRAVYVDDDKTWVTITDSDGDYVKHDISPSDMRSIKKDMRDKEFTIKVENISGSNITLRRLHGKLNVLQRKGV